MILVLFWIGFSIAVGVGASNKGRSGGGWFLLSLLISPLLAGVFLLVSKDLTPRPTPVVTVAPQAEDNEPSKRCPRCAEHIKQAALVCRFCGYEFPPSPPMSETEPQSSPKESAQVDGAASDSHIPPVSQTPGSSFTIYDKSVSDNPKYIAIALVVVVIALLIYGANSTKTASTNQTLSGDTQPGDASATQSTITGSADALSPATPPDSFRGIKWDSKLPSIARLRKTAMKGCASVREQTTIQTTLPCSHMHIDTDDIDLFDQHENIPPLFDVAVSEQMFTWSYRKFWSGQIFLQNESDISKLRQHLISSYGPPTFENNSLRVTKWKWATPTRKVSIQLYTDNHGVVSLLLTQDE